jgi:hypothetical protein
MNIEAGLAGSLAIRFQTVAGEGDEKHVGSAGWARLTGDLVPVDARRGCR